jgi:carboxypeptidase C (cathepsin A)
MMIFGNCYINKKVWLVILICGFLSLYIGLNGINPNYMALAKPDNETQVTHHTLGIYDEEMNYSATVGFIPIVDQKSQTEQARIFYIAYNRQGIEKFEKRAITFAFNGGPGAASMMLHLGVLGPRVVEKSKDGTRLMPPPFRLVDNPNTLLDITDLVFIDPIGTGYSRMTGGADPTQYWGVSEDVRCIAQFIQSYLNHNGRSTSPVIIAGESYGGVRGSGLAKVLQDIGVYPSGLIFISPVFDLGTIQWSSLDDRALALTIPTYAAAAWYHKKIHPDYQGDLDSVLQEVRAWVENHYLKALWRGNALSEEERDKIVEKLSQYTGIAEDFIREKNLRVYEDDFASELLNDKGLALGIYDARVTIPGTYVDEDDPSYFLIGGPFKSCLADYLKNDLQFESNLSYLSGSAEVYEKWNWESGRPVPKYEGTVSLGYPNQNEELSKALRRSDFLKVFIASGVYDLECPYDSVLYSINHLDLPAERRNNITLRIYPGGHMLYTNPEALAQLKKDLEEFYQDILGE